MNDFRFGLIIAAEFTQREADDAFTRQIDGFASDAVDSLVNYVASIGDARINGGWNFS
jgi:hypothetical protein